MFYIIRAHSSVHTVCARSRKLHKLVRSMKVLTAYVGEHTDLYEDTRQDTSPYTVHDILSGSRVAALTCRSSLCYLLGIHMGGYSVESVSRFPRGVDRARRKARRDSLYPCVQYTMVIDFEGVLRNCKVGSWIQRDLLKSMWHFKYPSVKGKIVLYKTYQK